MKDSAWYNSMTAQFKQIKTEQFKITFEIGSSRIKRMFGTFGLFKFAIINVRTGKEN